MSDRKSPKHQYFYIMWDGRYYKVGITDDVARRLKDFRTGNAAIQLVAFMIDKRAIMHEARILSWFKDARVNPKNEQLHPTGEVVDWVERFTRSYNTATELGAVSWSHESVFPWSPDPVLTLRTDLHPRKKVIEGQEGMFDVTFAMGGLEAAGYFVTDYIVEKKYTDWAHEVLHGIDLDPMSDPVANLTIDAADILIAEVDALKDCHVWRGSVWLHPPWDDNKMKQRAVRKLIHHYESGDVDAAIICLAGRSLNDKWFKRMLDEYHMCSPTGRPKYIQPGGVKGTPPMATVFVYLGKEVDRFQKVFGVNGIMRHPTGCDCW